MPDAVERLGGLDVAVANAGIGGQHTLVDGDESVWDSTIAVNLTGTFNLVRAAGPHVAHPGGYFLLTASLAAAIHLPLMSAYCASKAAVESLGDSLRLELAPSGAKVGVAYYAELDTDMTSRGFATEAAKRMPIGGNGRLPVAPVGPAIDALERGIVRRSRRVVLAALGRGGAHAPHGRPAGGRARDPAPPSQGAGDRALGASAADHQAAMTARAVLAALLATLPLAAPAQAAQVSQNTRFTASDGVSLQTTISGEGTLAPRPVLVEFSPYGRNSGTLDPGPAFNSLLVQIRGTGDSDGRFDALGPRTQADVAEVLRWACDQPWSDGRLAVNGFSASAITIYNSLHRALPCVKAAVLKSGTFELYRDLIWPGGISNLVPAAGVMGLIGAPALAQGGDRLSRNPASGADIPRGLIAAGLSGMLNSTLDSWWRERGFRGDVNHLPTL